MRIFWALIALLVLLAAGLVVFRTPTVRTPVAPAPAPVTMPAVTPDAAATAATAPTAAPVEAEKPASATDAAPQATAADLAAAAEAEQAMLDAIAEKHSGPKHAALVVDEQYIVRGEGTAEKPFVVSWEMLVASEGDFDPSKGKNTIPERVAMLHGKIVSITGYVAFPLMTPKPTELLMMLNQWDGCCMGVPPTPYDAIEVKINKAVTGDARFAINGTVRGTFKVEPYVTKTPTVSWLNGLYLMENAEFAAADIGAGAGS
jgi:hypothetical protein